MTPAEQLLEVLAKAGRPMTTMELASALGLESRLAYQRLGKLLERGLVQRSKSGGKGSPAADRGRRWRLHPTAKPASTAEQRP